MKKILLLMVACLMLVTAAMNDSSFKLDSSPSHKYLIEVLNEGVLSLGSLVNQDMILYSFDNDSTGEQFVDGETIKPGKYTLEVYNKSSSLLDYQISVGGVTLSQAISKTLPSLNVTNPTQDISYLSMDAKTASVSGNTDGIGAIVTQYNSPEKQLTPTFSTNINVGFGENAVWFSGIHNNGNETSKTKTIISPGTKRISGIDRYQTAVNIRKELESFNLQGDTVILLEHNSFSDGIPAIPLAILEQAPILYTASNSLNLTTKEELNRLKPQKVIILGGAISTTIETELRNMGIPTIERISGPDRYETSVKIAERILDEYTSMAYIVYGEDFPDGLAAGPSAARYNAPILLTRTGSLPLAVENFIKANPNIKEFKIVGGSAVVSDGVMNYLSQFGEVSRIGGSTRYDVSANVNKGYGAARTGAVMATGTAFPDGLPAAVLAGIRGYHLLLTPPTSVSSSTIDFLNTSAVSNFYIIGGTGAISSEVEAQLKNYLME